MWLLLPLQLMWLGAPTVIAAAALVRAASVHFYALLFALLFLINLINGIRCRELSFCFFRLSLGLFPHRAGPHWRLGWVLVLLSFCLLRRKFARVLSLYFPSLFPVQESSLLPPGPQRGPTFALYREGKEENTRSLRFGTFARRVGFHSRKGSPCTNSKLQLFQGDRSRRLQVQVSRLGVCGFGLVW